MMDTRVRDWSTEPGQGDVRHTYRSLGISVTRLALAFMAVWILLFAIQHWLPFVQNGGSVVGQIKYQMAAGGRLFRAADRKRFFMFGNSKTLAGLNPDIFDHEFGDHAQMVNLAIPGTEMFVDLLEKALLAGTSPTHILLQSLPKRLEEETVWSTIKDNKAMINLIFPFRNYVRDAIIFVFEAGHPRNMAGHYRSNAEQVAQLIADRGYYFIKSQSRYPDDRLPADYSLPTDQPKVVRGRSVDTDAPELLRLYRLAEQYDFNILLVPTVFRRGEYAVANLPEVALTAALQPFRRISVVGPAYLLYEPEYFSDPIHLNPNGARRYSTELAGLVRQTIEKAP